MQNNSKQQTETTENLNAEKLSQIRIRFRAISSMIEWNTKASTLAQIASIQLDKIETSTAKFSAEMEIMILKVEEEDEETKSIGIQY